MPPKKDLKWIYSPFPEEIIKQIDEIVAADQKPLGHWHSRADFMVSFINMVLENYQVFLSFYENRLLFEQWIADFMKRAGGGKHE